MAANVVLLGEKVTALQKSLSWITGATSMRGGRGKRERREKERKERDGRKPPKPQNKFLVTILSTDQGQRDDGSHTLTS